MSYAIEVFSNEWWINNIVSIFFISLLLFIASKVKDIKDYLSKYTRENYKKDKVLSKY